mgnify:CR=1 FL=1
MFEISTQIGRVRFEDESSCLYIQTSPGGFEYEIDLKRCRTPEQVCDWLFHLDEKNWSREIMPDLVKMLRQVVPSDLWAGKG